MTDWLLQASASQAEVENLRSKLEKYETFYKEISKLCLRHEVIHCVDGEEYASVSPRKISDALVMIDKEWYKNI